MTERIEAQIERFAPGFGELVLDKRVAGTTDLERWNPNLVGGDINGGYMDLRQLFARPMPRLNPYSTPARGLYICSSSTPPGGGVHGMCGDGGPSSLTLPRVTGREGDPDADPEHGCKEPGAPTLQPERAPTPLRACRVDSCRLADGAHLRRERS